jgi:hypothetical protein
MTDADRISSAFGYASEKTKQLITLATSILAITITFSKDVLGGVVAWAVIPLLVAWLMYLISIVAGVQLLGRFAARIQASPIDSETLNEPDIAQYARRQVLCFLWGLSFTITFGFCEAFDAVMRVGGLSKHFLTH